MKLFELTIVKDGWRKAGRETTNERHICTETMEHAVVRWGREVRGAVVVSGPVDQFGRKEP